MPLMTEYEGLTTFQFGNRAKLADRLAVRVVVGVKTATCSAAVHGPETVRVSRLIDKDCANTAAQAVATERAEAYMGGYIALGAPK